MLLNTTDRNVTLLDGATFTLTPMDTDEIPDWIAEAMPHPLSYIVGVRDVAGWSVRDADGVLVGHIFQRDSRFHAEYISQVDGDWYCEPPHRNRFEAAVAAIRRGRADEMYWVKRRAAAAA